MGSCGLDRLIRIRLQVEDGRCSIKPLDFKVFPNLFQKNMPEGTVFPLNQLRFGWIHRDFCFFLGSMFLTQMYIASKKSE
jgi:hypothetical protein